MEEDSKKPEPEPEPVEAKDEAPPDSAKPESRKEPEPPPPPLVHPPPGPPPATSIRLLKSVATIAGVAAILGLVAYIAQTLGRDPAPQEEEVAPAVTRTQVDEPAPPATIPNPFGTEDPDATATKHLVPDDTMDASPPFRGFVRFDGGRYNGPRPHHGGDQ